MSRGLEPFCVSSRFLALPHRDRRSTTSSLIVISGSPRCTGIVALSAAPRFFGVSRTGTISEAA